jgi:hypothetical protein
MSNELIGQPKSFDLSAPQQAMQVAEILQRFVKEKKLTANIKGKEYPLVEAWAFAGSQLGLYPLLMEVKNLSLDALNVMGSEIKYQATVEIRKLGDNTVLSRGVAVCSNKEASKRSFDEYAICSMAQTRAEGKAFRMLLSWIMKAAGFEATPAEEMDFAKQPEPDFSDVPDEGERQLLRQLAYDSDLNAEEMEQAMTAIDLCTNFKTYEKIQHRLEVRAKPIDQIINPSMGDINNHLKQVQSRRETNKKVL